MKKTFKMEDLDCAHCAAKMEDAIKKLYGVANANLNFLSQKVTIEAAYDRFEDIVKEAAKACKKIEPDCRIIVK